MQASYTFQQHVSDEKFQNCWTSNIIWPISHEQIHKKLCSAVAVSVKSGRSGRNRPLEPRRTILWANDRTKGDDSIRFI